MGLRVTSFTAKFIGFALGSFAVFGCNGGTRAEEEVHCGSFAQGQMEQPQPRVDPHARRWFADISAKARSHSYRVLFLGDSITERWDSGIWQHYFEPLDVLNAGVSGDRTEHVLWRIDNGNIYQQRPRAVVLLIGTNDLGHGRTPQVTAEGIRSVLIALRKRIPEARILLLGLWPRIDVPKLSDKIGEVNNLISKCHDGIAVTYLAVGRSLLDREGHLTHVIAPDGLHLSPDGYQLVSPKIAAALKAQLADR
jgi:lysophospholipase L1-like esterase